MNVSGKSVGALARFYKIQPQEILVVHDELDFPPGVAKLKLAAGSPATTASRTSRRSSARTGSGAAASHRPPGEQGHRSPATC